MRMPGFMAEVALYESNGYYHGTRTRITSATHVVPAIPSEAQCEYAFDKCFDDAVPSGVNRAACHVLGRCSTSGGSGGGESGGTSSDWLDFAICTALCKKDEKCVDAFC